MNQGIVHSHGSLDVTLQTDATIFVLKMSNTKPSFMRSLLLLLLSVAVVSCEKNTSPAMAGPLIGAWGPVPPPDGRALVFQTNGDLVYKQWDTVLAYAYNRYLIVNDSTLTFYHRGDSDSTRVGFKINGYVLQLNGACGVVCSELLYKILPID